MGDSDDDGDYKRRDKFRSERRGYDGGGGRDGGSPPRREYRDARPGPPGGGGGRRGGGGYEGIELHTLRSLLNKPARLTILRKFSTLLALIRVLLA